MRRIVFREGLASWRRRKALDFLEGFYIKTTLVAPRTYRLEGQPQTIDAIVRAYEREALLEVPAVGET